MAEMESVSARNVTPLNPTDEDETAHVLRQRWEQARANR